MKIDIITLFPNMFKGPFDESMVKRAIDKNLVQIQIHDLRQWGFGKRRTVDNRPYGGGVGMILMVEPLYHAIEEIKAKSKGKKSKVILLTPRGTVFNQKKATELAKIDNLIIVSGHYEGCDERITEFIDEEISIGDYILTGGEIPAMVLVDSIVRLIPKVLEKEATELESFQQQTSGYPLLEFPQYTRPENFKGFKVPKILISGNHKEIARWRKEKAIEKTKKIRPDLIEK